MARVPMVTRAIKTTTATVLIVNLEDENTSRIVVSVPRTFTDEKGLLKAINDKVNSDTVKVIRVIDSTVTEVLYGMGVAEFMSYAKVLDGETRRAIESEEK